MNSWHLALTILAVCTVLALATQQNIEITAQADIFMPNGTVGTVYFSQLSGSKQVKVTMKLYNLPSETNAYYVSPNISMGNDCKGMGYIYSPDYTKINAIFGYIHGKDPVHSRLFNRSVDLEGEHSILGRGVAILEMRTKKPFACGVIRNTTKNPENSTTTTPRTSSTTTTCPMFFVDCHKFKLESRRRLSTYLTNSTPSTTTTITTTGPPVQQVPPLPPGPPNLSWNHGFV